MKKMYQLLAAVTVAILVPLAISAPSSAASTCDIGFTGPDSQNRCTSVETYQCSVTNTNTVIIKNTNNQEVASGAVSIGGNTTGETATSGSVTNSNGTTFTVSITNADPNVQGNNGVCSATVIIPAKVTPETVQPTQKTTAKALPVTSGDHTLAITGIAAGVAAFVAAGAVTSVLIYRRTHNS